MKKRKPDWTPEDSGIEFASSIIEGSEIKNSKKEKSKKISLKPEDYVNGVINKDITILARAITLIESNSSSHKELGQSVLQQLIPHSGKSIRIGITGAPGAGKSTFIDTFGTKLCELGHKVAVLAIDPSSSLSKGSILGDKTRMESLSINKNAFIRPSSTGGNLGGVAGKTRESILVCEAAEFDVIIVETVGAGQSEILVRSMVDIFLLLLLPDEGDELQGFKKGSVELSDIIIINKADSDNINSANITKQQYKQAVHYLMNTTEGWNTKVLTASAINKSGIDEIIGFIYDFKKITMENGVFESRRKSQTLDWMHSILKNNLYDMMYKNPHLKDKIKIIENEILSGLVTPNKAVEIILDEFIKSIK